MIKDEVKVKFIAGKGGNGAVKFDTKFHKYPLGGDGGIGGDLYLEGNKDMEDLSAFQSGEIFKAEDGQPGGVYKQKGKKGEALYVKVPLNTTLYSLNDEFVCTIKGHGEQFLLIRGGEGGIGNYQFRSEGFESRSKFTTGKKGKEFTGKLVVKLTSDIVFIGFPNAGKSSILNALTRANVKIGNYPFTTLSPHLGSISGLKLMDLPGLIEGTHEGKGLGTSFIKHTESAKLIAHFISLESENMMKDYETMRKELENISSELAKKPEIIVVTKSDLFYPEEVEEKVKELKSLNKQIVVCSAYYPESLKELENAFRNGINS